MKTMKANPTKNTYDIYSAAYKSGEKGLVKTSKWEFDCTVTIDSWEDIWKNNKFSIQDNYFMLLYNDSAFPTVCLFAEYNTKTYINLQKLYDEYMDRKHQEWNREYSYWPGARWRHFVHYRTPHTAHSLKNSISREDMRGYREEYPNTKLKLKNRRIKKLPTTWDDIPRNYYKSWKDCTKKRHKYE